MQEYYLQDTRQYVGNNMLWWAKDCKGYTCNIRKAHVFTQADKDKNPYTRGTDLYWPKEYIDRKISHNIDRQDVNPLEFHSTCKIVRS